MGLAITVVAAFAAYLRWVLMASMIMASMCARVERLSVGQARFTRHAWHVHAHVACDHVQHRAAVSSCVS